MAPNYILPFFVVLCLPSVYLCRFFVSIVTMIIKVIFFFHSSSPLFLFRGVEIVKYPFKSNEHQKKKRKFNKRADFFVFHKIFMQDALISQSLTPSVFQDVDFVTTHSPSQSKAPKSKKKLLLIDKRIGLNCSLCPSAFFFVHSDAFRRRFANHLSMRWLFLSF